MHLERKKMVVNFWRLTNFNASGVIFHTFDYIFFTGNYICTFFQTIGHNLEVRDFGHPLSPPQKKKEHGRFTTLT